MITETSRIDHRVRISHRLILAIIVLLSALPVYTAFSQEDSALKSPVDTTAAASQPADVARPSLDDLMLRFADTESRYEKFEVKEQVTFAFDSEESQSSIGTTLRGKSHSFTRICGQVGDKEWNQTLRYSIDGKLQAIESPDVAMQIENILSTSTKPVAHAGVFSLYYGGNENGWLLTEFYRKHPERVMLEWDGPDAVLSFTGPTMDENTFQSKLWLTQDSGMKWVPRRYWMTVDCRGYQALMKWETHGLVGKDWFSPDFRRSGIAEMHWVNSDGRKMLDLSATFVVENQAFGDAVQVPQNALLQPPEESSNSVNERRKRYAEHEKQVQKLVTRLKTITREFGQDDPTTVKLRSDLRDAVRQSFEARQDLQRAELAEFARRMKNLQQSIDARDRIVDKIVERRLKELQDPVLNWEATESMNESKPTERAVNNIEAGISEKIEDGAWGEPVRGLRMAVVNLSDNAPSDKPLEIVCVLENVSDQRIVLYDGGWSLQNECDIRTTSKAQVKTIPVGMNTGALSGDRDKVLDPGQRIVISRIQICITDDPEATEVPDSANLLIVDRESSRFRNAIYLLRCNLRAQLKGADLPAVPLASGQIAIGFHYPEERASHAPDDQDAKAEVTESPASTAPPIPLLQESVTENNRQPPTYDAEKAISRLVIVFFQDQARRAVPGLMIDRGTETLVLTTGPATIVPDGVPHALDRAFLEFPGEANVRHTIDSPMNSGETPASSQIRQFLPTRQTMKPARFYMTFIGFMALALSDSCFAQASEPGPGKQVEQSFATSDGGTVSYLLYLPTDYDPAQKSNLILFLHGRGESYGPLNLVAKWGPPQFAARGDELPYVLVSPQCPGDDSWAKPTQQQRLIELLDHVVQTHSIDEDSVCLTGLSMGGYGSWRLAADHPGRFASVVPVCGGGDPGDAEKLKALPIWVFHGDQDSAVPFQRSVDMVDAIRKVGGTKIRFTSLEHVGHNCWSATYATPELFQWISEQKH